MKRFKEFKIIKWLGRYPLFLILAVSGILLTGIGVLGSGTDYLPYRQMDNQYQPVSWVFLGIKDGIYPWEVAINSLGGGGNNRQPEDEMGTQGREAAQPVDGVSVQREETGQEEDTLTDAGGKTQEEGAGIPEVDGKLPQTYEFETVDESYFDDALFIGDSRTVGLWEYAGIEERADFYCKTSLTIWDILDKPFVKTEDGREVTVEEALQDKSYGKIYLMVGINELGRGNTGLFMEEYARVVERLRELQPDAILFVEGIMRVAGEKSRTDPIFNNRNINEKNENIAKLADYSTIFYIDVNEAVCDENGDLIADYTFDQIHLKAAYYEIWKAFLLEHGIVRG